MMAMVDLRVLKMLESLESHLYLMIKLGFKIFRAYALNSIKSKPIKDTLEFNLGPDKRFLKLCETRLAFTVEIPENYYLDNDVFSKMVETTEIIVCHESITRKSTPLDNAVTSAIFNKLNMETGLLNSSLATHGIFSSRLYN